MQETERNKLIIDAYNANPTSMRAALDNFKQMQVHPKMAILGDMKELGACSKEEHRLVIEQLKEAGFQRVWLVGEQFASVDSPFEKFANIEEVKVALEKEPLTGYYILIKGSNSMRLASVTTSL